MSKRKAKSGQSVKAAWDKTEIRIAESILQLTNSYVDPNDALDDPESGERWMTLGEGGSVWERYGYPRNEQELSLVRNQCRYLACENPFAINGHENRISYIVGSGHTYTVQAKPDAMADDDELKTIQAVIDEFIEKNAWHKRQQEIVLRKDRDGECFLRFFADADGGVRVRFVEPKQVCCPSTQAGSPENSFGIQSDPADVETVLGFWIDGQLVDAAEIQHRKANVDCNVKRGMPMFWPVRKNLRRVERLLRNMSVVGEIQTAIALIRKHAQGTKAGVQQFVQGNADVQTTNAATGEGQYYKRYAPGTVLDASVGTEYEFPARGLDAGKYVAVLQAELRAIASRLVMPEFMLSSDASNANYSSTMVAEGPAVKMFQRWQWDMIVDDLEVMRRVIAAAIAAGTLATDVLDRVKVTAIPPTVQTRNRLSESQADQILVTAGAMSVQTMAERNDLDWDAEERRIDERRAKTTPAQLLPFAGMDNKGQDNGGDPNADPNKPDPNADPNKPAGKGGKKGQDDTQTAFETWRGLVESIKLWRKKS